MRGREVYRKTRNRTEKSYTYNHPQREVETRSVIPWDIVTRDLSRRIFPGPAGPLVVYLLPVFTLLICFCSYVFSFSFFENRCLFRWDTRDNVTQIMDLIRGTRDSCGLLLSWSFSYLFWVDQKPSKVIKLRKTHKAP